MADNGPPTGGGGGAPKRRRRKRGGGGGGNKDKDAPPAAKKDSASSTASTTNAPPSSGGGRGGNKGRKRGGGGGRGGGGESSSSRMNKSATSPLQLPHVKVTLRNIGNASKHDTVEGVVDSIRTFLEGTFPSTLLEDNNGNSGAIMTESSAYMMAWQLEKEEFEQNKSIFAAEVSSSSSSNTSAASEKGSDSSSSIRAFASGVYKDKPSPPPPSNRQSLLPSAEPIVSELNEAAFTSINSMIDAAMSKMMQECGKQYIPYVGGRVVLDEESAVDCVLAEKIQAERLKKKKKKDGEGESAAAAVVEDENAGATLGESTAAGDGDDAKPSSVESVTKGMEKLSTSDKSSNQKSNNNKIPAIRVRILSVTPVKKSKRRGEIGAKVQLVLYPPDPCLLFQELCRDTGKLVVEKSKMTSESKSGEEESNKEEMMEMDKSSTEKNGDGDKPTLSPSTTVKAAPQIPNFPLLTSSERSRALARSRILINRTIEAMKIGAKTLNTRGIDNNRPWEIFESPSQKTWKPRQNPMIGSLLAGASLQDVIAENEKAKANAASSNKKGRERFKSREDRYDSTIENSEDYKTFMQHWQNDGAYPSNNPGDDAAKKKEPVAVDEEGRPLSAIVMDIRKKKDEEAKKKADAKAAAAKAREAARSAQEALKKKEKSKKKKEKDKNRRNERRKKAKAAARAPPTLLQKAGAGFGG